MIWIPLSSSGSSWWLQSDEGITQGYVIKIKGQYLPRLMGGGEGVRPHLDTLEAAQERVLVLLAERKLEGT
jgi:hypothetical protein